MKERVEKVIKYSYWIGVVVFLYSSTYPQFMELHETESVEFMWIYSIGNFLILVGCLSWAWKRNRLEGKFANSSYKFTLGILTWLFTVIALTVIALVWKLGIACELAN